MNKYRPLYSTNAVRTLFIINGNLTKVLPMGYHHIICYIMKTFCLPSRSWFKYFRGLKLYYRKLMYYKHLWQNNVLVSRHKHTNIIWMKEKIVLWKGNVTQSRFMIWQNLTMRFLNKEIRDNVSTWIDLSKKLTKTLV